MRYGDSVAKVHVGTVRKILKRHENEEGVVSEAIKELATALSKAQAEIKHAVKTAENPFFKSSYADLKGVWDACRPALAAHGLSVVQTTRIEVFDGKPTNILKTILLHESGESIEGEVVLRPMTQVKGAGWVPSEDPQSIGSAMTYARRYALAAICGVATEDDDGNAASGKKDGKQKDTSQAAVPPPPAAPAGAVSAPAPAPATDDQAKVVDGMSDDQLRSALNYMMQVAQDTDAYPKDVDALYAWTCYTKDGKTNGFRDLYKLKGWQMKNAIKRAIAAGYVLPGTGRQPGEDAEDADVPF
jgi:hypothetical protein